VRLNSGIRPAKVFFCANLTILTADIINGFQAHLRQRRGTAPSRRHLSAHTTTAQEGQHLGNVTTLANAAVVEEIVEMVHGKGSSLPAAEW
jgi:hypothetical protein